MMPIGNALTFLKNSLKGYYLYSIRENAKYNYPLLCKHRCQNREIYRMIMLKRNLSAKEKTQSKVYRMK